MAKKKFDVHKWIGIFLIIIGILPFLDISTGIFTTIIRALTIVCGIVILMTN